MIDRHYLKHIVEINAIACVSQNGVIGYKNQLPWGNSLKKDLKYFSDITKGACVIMGNNTFKSIGSALPNRHNIVISKKANRWSKYLLDFVNSLDQALEVADLAGYRKVFIIGGESVYRQAFQYIDNLYITRVLKDYNGDTFFPEFNNLSSYFELIEKSDVIEENSIKYQFEKYEKHYSINSIIEQNLGKK